MRPLAVATTHPRPPAGDAHAQPSRSRPAFTPTPATTLRAHSPKQHHPCAFNLKSIERVTDDVGDWKFAGYFSVFDVRDHEGDVVRRGAFTKSLAALLPKVKDHHGITAGQASRAPRTTTASTSRAASTRPPPAPTWPCSCA